MRATEKRIGFTSQDLLASCVVFLVALPLCMGVAIASGVDPVQGLVTGIVGGLVVSMLGGAPLQVSGPAAGLTVIVFDIVRRHREVFLQRVAEWESLEASARQAVEMQATQFAMAALGLAVLLAGLMQLAAGLAGLGRWFRAVSPAVIYGMLSGIGIIIAVSQVHVMMDHAPAGSPLSNIAALPAAIGSCFSQPQHAFAAAVGLLTLVLMIVWPRIATSRLRLLPAALIAVATATILSQVLRLDLAYVSIPANLLAGLILPGAVWLELVTLPTLWISAVALALVASAETLLCTAAVDQLHSGPRANYDRELTAQGVGNTICGLLGALPMTGVIVRSSANIAAGARSHWSAFLHGLWLLVLVAMFPAVLNLIPTASLAAVLVYTGYKLVDVKRVQMLWNYSRGEVAVYLVTVGTIVGKDLLLGVLVGIAVSAARLLYSFSNLHTSIEYRPGNAVHLRLAGTATFLRLPILAAALEHLPRESKVSVDISGLQFIDHACLELLSSWSKQHQTAGGTVDLDWEVVRARATQPTAAAPRTDERRQRTAALAGAPD